MPNKDSNVHWTFSTDWDAAKKDGAMAAEVVVYSDSKNGCDRYVDPSLEMTSSKVALVVNIVVQFRDDRGATNAYAVESLLNASASEFRRTFTRGVVEGAASGLGKNSLTVSTTFFELPVYFAFWQNKVFLVALEAFNVDAGQSKKIATNVNRRIDQFKTDSPKHDSGVSYTRPGPISVTGAVGQPMVLKFATVTVTGANLDGQPPEGARMPETANRIVRVDFEVLYTRTGHQFQFELSDSSGLKYEEGGYTDSPLDAGNGYRGYYWYRVPKTATGLKVRIQVGDDSATVPLG
jgi:hypothetical protein